MTGNFRAQGATEYLVLLSIVLVIALVAIAIMVMFMDGSFDAQILQTEMYWESASPVAITEWAAAISQANPTTTDNSIYLRVKNNGAYSIRITKVLSRGLTLTTFWGGGPGCTPSVRSSHPISDYYYLSPGEEKYFGYKYTNYKLGSVCDYALVFPAGRTEMWCVRNEPGYFKANDFGFEYIEYINGHTVTKRQTGKPVIAKCIVTRIN